MGSGEEGNVMSGVRKKDQSPHRFTTLDLILKMYDHTTTILANEKIFNPKYQKLIDSIDANARQIYHLCRVANEELDNRIKEEAEHRLVLQEEAIDACRWLRTEIMLAQRKFHLRAKKVVYWDSLVVDAMSSIKNWNNSEKRLYKENHGL